MRIMSRQVSLIALLMTVVSMGLFGCVRERSVGCPDQMAIKRVNIGYDVTRFADKTPLRADLNDPSEDNVVRNAYLFIFHDNDLVRSRYFDNDKEHVDQPRFAYSLTDKVLEKYENNGYGRFSFYLIANVTKEDGSGASSVFDNITVEKLKDIRTKAQLFSLVAESKAKSDLVSKDQAAEGVVINQGVTATGFMERQVKDLLMVGAIENVDMDHLDTSNLPAGLSYDASTHTMTVDIPLKKLVSKVTFDITVDERHFKNDIATDDPNPQPGDGIKAVHFMPREWQLYRAPRYATLFPGYKPTNEAVAGTATNNPISDDTYYIDSKVQRDFDQSSSGTVNEHNRSETARFSFYCLQNYKSPLKEITGNLDDSRDPIYLREKQEKTPATNADGYKFVENGKFIYAKPNATYVRFSGNIVTIYQKGGRIYKDLVEATYTIHLIDPDDAGTLSPNNYNIAGNCNYTYNIKLTGYEDLKYEVNKAEAEGHKGDSQNSEQNPGAEGNYYSDIQSFDIDAHYSKVLLKVYTSITDEENEQPFFVNTPFDYPSRDKATGGKIDVNWVHFMPIPKEFVHFSPTDHRLLYDHVPLYPGDDIVKASANEPDLLKKKFLTVNELRPYMRSLSKAGNEALLDKYLIPGEHYVVFVAFIDEYYYDLNPVTGKTITDFNTFVNARPRKMWIRTAIPHRSYDGKTTQVASAIEIDQVAIQSIYSPSSKRSVGVEAYDESYGIFSSLSSDNYTKFNTTRDQRYDTAGRYIFNNPISQPKTYEYRGDVTSCIAWGLLPAAAADPIGHSFQDLVNTYGWQAKPWSDFLQEQNAPGKTPHDMDLAGSYSICDAPNSELGGWYGTIKTLYDSSQSDYLDDQQAKHFTYANCLSRNRDSNGNGVIDQDEVKWVLPTLSVVEDMQVSRYSFQRPEYRIYAPANFVDKLQKDIILRYPHATPTTSSVGNLPFLFTFTSSYIPANGENGSSDAVWLHELLSVSPSHVIGNGWSPTYTRRTITRCVRILGKSTVNMQNPFYFDKANKVINLYGTDHNLATTRFPPTAYRNTDINPVHGALPIHSTFSRVNIPAMRFQIADRDVTYHSQYLLSNKECNEYYQNADKSDLGKWRVPNSCEMHYMQLAMPDPMQDNSKYATCTFYDDTSVPNLREAIQKGTGDSYTGEVILGRGRIQTRGYASKLRCIRELGSKEQPSTTSTSGS